MSERAKPPKPGAEYEKIVADIHRQFAGDAEVTENEFITGKRSGQARQIDVSVRSTVAGHPVLVVVECKDYQRKVSIGKVDELLAKIEDVGAAVGVLVSNSGFSQGAIDRAASEGNIQLASVIDVQNRKIRTYLTFPCIYEHLSIPDGVTVRTINSDGTKFLASQYELQKFLNTFIADWNEGTTPCEAGYQEHRRMLNNTYTRQEIGVQFFYTVKQELFRKRLNMASGTGIYNVQLKNFRTNGFSLEHFPFRPEEVRRSWEAVPPEAISDDKITETTLQFRTLQMLEPVALDGSRTIYP